MRGRWLAWAALCAGCGRIGFDTRDAAVADADPDAPDTGRRRKPVTITPGGTESLERFPVSIVLASDADLAARAMPDGSDLVFRTTAGEELAAELVAYDGVTGALEAWVEIPMLAPAGTTIELAYGGASATRANPWLSLFAAVWHMDLDGETLPDRARGHTAMRNGTRDAPTPATGVVGVAAAYDGVDDSMRVDDPSDGSLDFGTRSFGYSVWVNVPTTVLSFDTPIHKGGSSLSATGYDMELGAMEWAAVISDGTVLQATQFSPGPVLGVWVQLGVVVDRLSGTVSVLRDGSVQGTGPLPVGSLDNPFPLQLGRDANPFLGTLDEVRIYAVHISSAYIEAEYRNIMQRATFMRVGPEELDP